MIEPGERLHEPGSCRFCGGSGKSLPDDGTRLRCYDCRRASGSYMVKDKVWREAWPDYAVLKRSLVRRYKGTPEWFRAHLVLCLGCLERRLGRNLTQDDFDLSLPINEGVALGLRMAGR